MITIYNKSFNEDLLKILNGNPLQNVYLLIDAETYGFEGENIKTWIIEDKDHNCQCIIYKYYNSIQLFETKYYDNVANDELSNFLLKYNFGMISGTSEIISKLHEKLHQTYNSEFGYVFKCNKMAICPESYLVTKATENHMDEIAKLICMDENIGGHYNVDTLATQLKERYLYKGCRNVIYTIEDRIVGHMATYAETAKIAVLGGLITDPEYRGKGIGKAVLQYLTTIIQVAGKEPILYCYDPHIYNWYESMGWIKQIACGKLERINR